MLHNLPNLNMESLTLMTANYTLSIEMLFSAIRKVVKNSYLI